MIAATLADALRHHQAGRLDRAEALYREVLAANPNEADALHLLGVAAHMRGRFPEAHALISRAIRASPSQSIYHANLGIVLESLGRPDEAAEAYQKALAVNPLEMTALNNLGKLHRGAWHLDEAAACYQAAIAHQPGFAKPHNNLGNVFADRLEFEQAIGCYRRALALDESFVDARHNLGIALAEQGRFAEASAELHRAAAERPDDAGLKIREALLLPVIPESAEAIDELRRALDRKLDRLLTEDLFIKDPILEAPGPAFYLAYHGRDDVGLQKKIAALFGRAVPSLRFTAPHCGLAKRQRSGPIRVGIISRFFHGHSVGDHYAKLFGAFPRAGVRYLACRFPGPEDDVSREIDAAADEVVPLSSALDRAREQIAACELDAILYTDIGMDPRTYFLAFARLAPVQCVTAGHPVTTGIPTIDYFLSCAGHELPEADAHYSERLVRLQNVPHYFVRPRLAGSVKSRADFPLPPEARWYVCQQALFKIHPEFDGVLGEILREDRGGIVVLFDGVQPAWKGPLLDRFRRSIPDVVDRIIFLPRLPYADYLAFLPLADALLDTMHFTGGTTTMQALGLGLPLVTLPGRFHRGRGTYSAYRRLGIDDCVAADAADYVSRAVRLANDPAFRGSIGSRIADRAGILFENRAAAAEIEAFLIGAVRETPPR